MTRRHIPSIEQVRQRRGVRVLEQRYGRGAVVDAVRTAAAQLRSRLTDAVADDDVGERLEAMAAETLRREFAPSLRRVINATGVIVHTNLGRAPLSAAAANAVTHVASGYSNLEYDLNSGSRGRRDVHAERLICRLTGADAACVVNNNAAATLITLAALAAGREVIVSRGELVEIGGGFRVPDVMAQSGAILREVGTTNRTRAADYAAAISERTAVILRVHPSNFRIEGFTERPTVGDLVALGKRFGVIVVDDLGSGYLGEPSTGSLRDEPAVAATLGQGADVVMFSGDKLLGGPQAGIIAGTRDAMDVIRRHPLMRALRVDKMAYAALEATLQAYAAGRADEEVPVARMIALSVTEVDARAQALAARLATAGVDVAVIDGHSTVGGGSAPGSQMATRLVQLRGSGSATDIQMRLRQADPPVIARIEHDSVVLDLRTVPPEDDHVLEKLLLSIVRS